MELVALLPLVAAVGLAVAHLLVAGLAQEQAAHAAEAAAVALVQDRDPRAAARDAVSSWARKDLRVDVRGRQVRVRLRPPALVGALTDLLSADERADAGPA